VTSVHGLAYSRRGFVLVSPEGAIIARAAPSRAAVEAMLDARAPPFQLAVAERIFRDAPEARPVLKRHALWIVPDGLVEAIQAASALRRSPRQTAALLARVSFLAWFRCDMRTTSPGSDRQIELF
jgi:hypothetical protein